MFFVSVHAVHCIGISSCEHMHSKVRPHILWFSLWPGSEASGLAGDPPRETLPEVTGNLTLCTSQCKVRFVLSPAPASAHTSVCKLHGDFCPNPTSHTNSCATTDLVLTVLVHTSKYHRLVRQLLINPIRPAPSPGFCVCLPLL